MNELLTHAGSAIKAVGRRTVGGFAVMFTSSYDVDREGDFFTKDTDYDLEGRLSVRGEWWHAKDKTVGGPLGRASFTIQDQGIYAELKLRDDETGARIFSLAEHDELSWSSGSASHLVRKQRVGNANWISVWPVTEFSILPREAAAEPRAKAVALKSLSDALTNDYKQRVRNAYVASVSLDCELRAAALKSNLSLSQRVEFEKNRYYELRVAQITAGLGVA